MDFDPDFKEFSDMLRCEYVWELVDNSVFSVKNMNDRELKESIIQDLLTVTMWELTNKKDEHFTISTLCKRIPREYIAKVKKLIKDEDICDMIKIEERRIRIYVSKKNLQAAMDYCGVWYDGYPPPKSTKVINCEKVRQAVEEIGSVEALATSMSMDICSNSPTTKTTH